MKVGITVRLGIISRFGIGGLVLSLGSCLAIIKVWNDGLTTAQAGRISQLLSHHTNNSNQGTVYSNSSDRYFIKQTGDCTLLRHRSRPTPEEWP